jgi:hypothetical protein
MVVMNLVLWNSSGREACCAKIFIEKMSVLTVQPTVNPY